MDQKPRQIAAGILFEWDAGLGFAENLLRKHISRSRLSSADRRMVQEIVYGVIRNMALLDAWIDSTARQPPGNTRSRSLLRLGFYQLGLMDRIPDHAAVHETVAAARRFGLHSQAGFINALLRRFVREKVMFMDQWEAWKRDQPAIGYSHPAWLIEKWQNQWSDAATRTLCQWNQSPPPVYARWNPMGGSLNDLLEQWKKEDLSFEEASFPWSDAHSIFAIKNISGSLAETESFLQGRFYVQDPSTLLAVSLLDPVTEDCLLDACAAPGGKTTAIASILEGRGIIHAVDPDSGRLKRLESNLERLQIRQVQTAENISQLNGGQNPLKYDGILIDAPCSNTGVMRRRLDVRWRIDPRALQACIEEQAKLLDTMTPHLKPGGRMVYSTCSLEPEENQQQTRDFLERHPGWTIEKEVQLLPWENKVDGAYAVRLRSPNSQGSGTSAKLPV